MAKINGVDFCNFLQIRNRTKFVYLFFREREFWERDLIGELAQRGDGELRYKHDLFTNPKVKGKKIREGRMGTTLLLPPLY